MQFIYLFNKSNSLQRIFYYSFYLIVLVYLLYLGPIKIGRDSFHYLDNLVIRSPLYPIILDFYTVLFSNWYHPLIAIKFISALLAVSFLLKILKERFILPDILIFVFSVILLTPYFFGDYKFANRLLTEGVCYPLYLISISLFLKFLFARDQKYFLYFLGCLALLILTRRQFLFMYPVILFILGYQFLIFEKKKQILACLVFFIFVALSVEAIERSYRLIKFDNFSAPPFFGIQFSVAPLYLSQKEDVDLIENLEEKKIFSEFFEKMDSKEVNIKHFRNSKSNNFYEHFNASYNTIAWGITHKTLSEKDYSWFEVDKTTKSIAWQLIINDPIKHAKLYFFGIKKMLGGYYLMAFYLMTFFICIISINFKKYGSNLLLFLSLLCSFSNYTLISLVETPLMRYSIYTEVIQIITFTMMFYEFLFMKKNK